MFKTKFDSLQEAEEEYNKAKDLFDLMVGSVYKSILAEQIIEIKREIDRLKGE